MSCDEVDVARQTGMDGIWLMSCFIDCSKFDELLRTKMFVVTGREDRFNGYVFRSVFENKDVPCYFFTNIRNYKFEKMEHVDMNYEHGYVDAGDLEKWLGGVSRFYSDVFVKMWKRDVTSDEYKIAWAAHWKSQILELGMGALSENALLYRHLCAHWDDVYNIERVFTGVMKNRNASDFVSNNSMCYMRQYLFDTYGLDDIDPDRVCSFCGWYDGSRMKRCPCKSGVRYCSPKCQSVHWRMVHKKECAWKKE
jgi:hypothetical protein